MAGGQPTKYKPEYCEMLIKHMAKGYSFQSFAADVNVDRDTLYEWAKVHAEFSDAHRKGTIQNLKYWEGNGIYISAKGKGNFSAWRYNMANRHGWRDNSVETETIDDKIQINIQIARRDEDDEEK